MIKKSIQLSVLILFMCSCSTIQNYQTLSKPTNQVLSSSIGGSVYLLKNTQDLPNAFGKADLFGGKVDKGYSQLVYMGLDESGDIIFRITNTTIDSNETTMMRYGTDRSVSNSNTSGSATVSGNTIYGNANTSTSTTHYKKREATVNQLPANTVEFLFNPNDKILKMDGVTVEIKGANNYSLSYILY